MTHFKSGQNLHIISRQTFEAKNQPVPQHGGTGQNGALVNDNYRQEKSDGLAYWPPLKKNTLAAKSFMHCQPRQMQDKWPLAYNNNNIRFIMRQRKI